MQTDCVDESCDTEYTDWYIYPENPSPGSKFSYCSSDWDLKNRLAAEKPFEDETTYTNIRT
jgi:hypothetical protein